MGNASSKSIGLADAGFLGRPSGLKSGFIPFLFSWIFSTDHKRIGILYLIGVTAFFFVGMLLGFLMRFELLVPEPVLLGPDQYNAVFTLHGVIMIFLVVIPAAPAIFGNLILPLQVGALDVAFPKLNNFTWWLFLVGGILAVVSLFTGGGVPDTGWTFYVPFSTVTNTNVTLAVFAVFILGFSSILTGINFMVTIHYLRAEGMTLSRVPLFCWGLYATGWVQVIATPVLAITVLLLFTDRMFDIGIFDARRGGDPIMYQHMFWLYSHPAVYLMILPAMGIVSDIIPVFARKRIYGYGLIAVSSVAIAFIGAIVWAHHMYTSGMSDESVILFSFLTFLVAIPTAVKVFNWIATLHNASIELEPPLYYCLAFIFLFTIGGLTGLVLGAAGPDIHVHDTYFVVAHFHYVIFGGLGFAMFAAAHYWLPKFFGRMYNRGIAKSAFWLTFIGFNILYFPLFVAGIYGMPRRYYTYDPVFELPNYISSLGSWILVTGLIMMLVNMVVGLRRGEPAGDNPWNAATLEWSVDTPPHHHSYHEPPVVTKVHMTLTR